MIQGQLDNRWRTASPSRSLQLWHHTYVGGDSVVDCFNGTSSYSTQATNVTADARTTVHAVESLTETRAETSHIDVKVKHMQLYLEPQHISKGVSRLVRTSTPSPSLFDMTPAQRHPRWTYPKYVYASPAWKPPAGLGRVTLRENSLMALLRSCSTFVGYIRALGIL